MKMTVSGGKEQKEDTWEMTKYKKKKKKTWRRETFKSRITSRKTKTFTTEENVWGTLGEERLKERMKIKNGWKNV